MARLVLYRRLAGLTAAVALAQIMIGGYVSATESGLGCGDDWPHCNGALVPVLGVQTELVEYFHRAWAAVLGVIGLGLLFVARRERNAAPEAARMVYAAAGLFGAQALLGGAVVVTMLRPELVALHSGLAATLFALLLLAYLRIPREAAPAARPEGASSSGAATPRSIARDYLLLVKPGILFLLVLTGITTMLVAGGLTVTPAQIAWTLLGGALSSASANTLNGYLERDLDKTMARTRNRPLPAGRIAPSHALVLALVFAALSMVVFVLHVNLLAGALALSGIFFYVFVYTAWLKLRTPQNIVIGGAAGSFPALVGWAAVTNEVTIPAVLLGALVLLWTPPHFWALALIYRRDYEGARVPMMPVVAGEKSTKRQMLYYSVALLAATLLFYPLGTLGLFYLMLALLLGSAFVYLAWRVVRDTGLQASRRLFRYSIWYLALLFLAMVVDKIAFA